MTSCKTAKDIPTTIIQIYKTTRNRSKNAKKLTQELDNR